LRGLVNSVVFAPHDPILAYGGASDHPAFLWDAHTKSYRQTPVAKHKGIVSAITFSGNGKAAAAYQDGTVFLWEIADANVPPVELTPAVLKLVTIAFSVDG